MDSKERLATLRKYILDGKYFPSYTFDVEPGACVLDAIFQYTPLVAFEFWLRIFYNNLPKGYPMYPDVGYMGGPIPMPPTFVTHDRRNGLIWIPRVDASPIGVNAGQGFSPDSLHLVQYLGSINTGKDKLTDFVWYVYQRQVRSTFVDSERLTAVQWYTLWSNVIVPFPANCGTLVSAQHRVAREIWRLGAGSLMDKIKTQAASYMGFSMYIGTVSAQENPDYIEFSKKNGWRIIDTFTNRRTQHKIYTVAKSCPPAKAEQITTSILTREGFERLAADLPKLKEIYTKGV